MVPPPSTALLLTSDLLPQLKMVLIKCCDISNEVRPMEVAEPWVDCLLEEYFMQVRVPLVVVVLHAGTSTPCGGSTSCRYEYFKE